MAEKSHVDGRADAVRNYTRRLARASGRRGGQGCNPASQICCDRSWHWTAPGFCDAIAKAVALLNAIRQCGYDPLPRHDEPADSPLRSPEANLDYPHVLTSYRHV